MTEGTEVKLLKVRDREGNLLDYAVHYRGDYRSWFHYHWRHFAYHARVLSTPKGLRAVLRWAAGWLAVATLAVGIGLGIGYLLSVVFRHANLSVGMAALIALGGAVLWELSMGMLSAVVGWATTRGKPPVE